MSGTYQRLYLPLSATPRDVIKAARRRIAGSAKRDRAWREQRHLFYRRMLECHRNWQELCRYWRM
jgi:hypothetical protein